MSKVYTFRAHTINGVTIPAGTALKEMGDGPMPRMIRYELPTSLHHCGAPYIDLYPTDVGPRTVRTAGGMVFREADIARIAARA